MPVKAAISGAKRSTSSSRLSRLCATPDSILSAPSLPTRLSSQSGCARLTACWRCTTIRACQCSSTRASATASTSHSACPSCALPSTTGRRSTWPGSTRAPARRTRAACLPQSNWRSSWPEEYTMHDGYLSDLRGVIEQIRTDGFYKTERVIDSPQTPQIRLADGQEVLNFCANNYLGLADDPRLVQAAKEGLDTYGFGMASVRFICGTQSVHKELETALSAFLKTEDSILYSSCFDANGGLFETLLDEQDAVISDELNHASIVDGIRLCKAKRYRYRNNDMVDLEAKLNEADAAGARFKLVATDGVFSMDGTVAQLAVICALADKHQALVMVDDSHAVGFIGAGGRGTPELCAVEGRVDVYTGTLGKALGGASGGYVAGTRDLVSLLRQRSRPYLFSNT